jgi:redox-sensitive bicupin YhaK (pirin superfamily)
LWLCKQNVPGDFTTFIYTLSGTALFGKDKSKAEPHTTLVFSETGDTITFETTGDSPAHFVLIAGKPIKEPIVQHGPFVMNKKEEIYQAFMDYRAGQNGFEHAGMWESEIGKRAGI